MSTMTERFDLPYVGEGQANAEANHNQAIDHLSHIIGLHILDRDLTTPPTVANGETYIVAVGATGVWAGEDGNLAMAINGAYEFKTPELGMPFYVADEGGGGLWTGSYNFRQIAPRVALRRTSVFSFGAETDIEWNSQITIDGHFIHDTGTNPERILIPEDGLYEIEAQLTIERTAGSGVQVVRMKAYDQATLIPGSQVFLAFDAQFATISLHRIDSLSGNYIKISLELISGGGTMRVAASGSFLKITRP